MLDEKAAAVTHESLMNASAADRVEMVVGHLLASVRALRPEMAGVDEAARLADLAIDSLQIVELKFGLDELIGSEVDIEVIIANPTIRELAEESLRRSGL